VTTLPLRFLADESCDFAVVSALRNSGFDVVAISETTHRSDDREVIDQAFRDRRILLTEDKDFGRLVFASHAESAGVILIRFPGGARATLARTICELVREHGTDLAGSFVVTQPGYVRITPRQEKR
jgi:predicted nuclease of predicted toxin-antitoxin system